MSGRMPDGSAGDADYGAIADGYSTYRRPDPWIADRIVEALGAARRVVNIGAGAGSYEPRDRDVTAVEPSASMRALRPAGIPPAIDAVAEDLPFSDAAFDAAMATFTVHQWPDLEAGLREVRRVTAGPIVILTADAAALDRFWLADYAPEVIATEARRYPSIERIARTLGSDDGAEVDVQSLLIPLDCRDGFGEAYYGRPEMILDPGARLANSAWSFVEPAVAEDSVARLRRDLASGAWDAAHGALRTQPFFDGSLRLIVGRP
jgi:SAM-dependent methyltransferase